LGPTHAIVVEEAHAGAAEHCALLARVREELLGRDGVGGDAVSEEEGEPSTGAARLASSFTRGSKERRSAACVLWSAALPEQAHSFDGIGLGARVGLWLPLWLGSRIASAVVGRRAETSIVVVRGMASSGLYVENA
jgi:hypothetical protein